MNKLKTFLKKYWREIAIVVMFFSILSGVSEAKDSAQAARHWAEEAWEIARDGSYYASEAADYAEQAAISAEYCEYLY